MNRITWALIGMVGYSFTTLLVKFATRSGQFSSFLVLAIACIITLTSTVSITLVRGDLQRYWSQRQHKPDLAGSVCLGVAFFAVDSNHPTALPMTYDKS